jgi:hypothetical protein
MHRFSLFPLLFVSAILFGQSPEDILQQNRAWWPEEDAVFLLVHEKVTITQQGDSLFSVAEKWEDRLILSSTGAAMNTGEVSHSDFFQLTELKAATLLPQKKKYKEVAVEDFTTKDVLSGSVFHDDMKETSFLYPGLEPGAQTRLYHKEHIADIRFFHPAYSFPEHKGPLLQGIQFHKSFHSPASS